MSTSLLFIPTKTAENIVQDNREGGWSRSLWRLISWVQYVVSNLDNKLWLYLPMLLQTLNFQWSKSLGSPLAWVSPLASCQNCYLFVPMNFFLYDILFEEPTFQASESCRRKNWSGYSLPSQFICFTWLFDIITMFRPLYLLSRFISTLNIVQ